MPKNFKQHLEQLHHDYVQDKTLSQLMLSPLVLTGKLHSLLLSHNSWFIYDILPKIGQLPKLDNIVYSSADFFNAMHFELCMDNGMAIPVSAQALHQIKQTIQ